MSEVSESTFRRFAKAISEMGPWDFQAAADSLGLSEEDQAASYDADIPPGTMFRLMVAADCARVALMNAEAGNPMTRPS
jgi:hypothetical protein